MERDGKKRCNFYFERKHHTRGAQWCITKWLKCLAYDLTDMSDWIKCCVIQSWILFFLHGEAAGLRGFGGGGLTGLEGREVLELPGDWEGEAVPLTASPLGTMTHSSESLEGDVSLLDLEIRFSSRSNSGLSSSTKTILQQMQCKLKNT